MWARKWRHVQGSDRPKTTVSALDYCVNFPNLSILLQVLSALPVTSAEAERTFSKIERTLSSIRASMGEHRLEGLILIQTHRDKVPSTDLIIDKFSQISNRRFNFSLN